MINAKHNQFYVYALSNPESGSIFYIGKGSGSRASQHAKDARNGVIANTMKNAKKNKSGTDGGDALMGSASQLSDQDAGCKRCKSFKCV